MSLTTTATLSLMIAIIGIVFSLAMLFLVVWQSVTQRANQLLAGYLATTIVWGMGFIMFRIIGEAYFPWFGVITWCYTVSGYLLFAFVTRFTEQWGNHWVRAVLGTYGSYCFVVLPVALALGLVYTEVQLTDMGRTFEFTPFGALSGLTTIVLTAYAVVSLYRPYRPELQALTIGATVVLLGQMSGLFPILREYPIPMISISLSSVFMVQVVLRQNLFNPMARMNEELAISREDYRHIADQLLMQQLLYQTLAENMPRTTAFLVDSNMRYLIVEGAALEEEGYDRDMMIGKTPWDVLPNPHAHEVAAYFRRALAGETAEYHMKTAHSSYDIQVVPVPGKHPNETHALMVMRDETERQQRLQKIKEDTLFIKQITQTMPDLVYVFDLTESRNIYTNREVTDILGYTSEEVRAMGSDMMVTIMHPEDIPRIVAHAGRFEDLPDYEIIELEYRAKHANGEWRYLHSRESVFKRDEAGNATQVMGVAQDVTTRYRMEREREHHLQKIKQDSQFISQVARTMPDLLYVFDLVEQRNVFVNREITEMLGYTLEDVDAMGTDLFVTIMHPDDIAKIMEHQAHFDGLEDDKVIELEYRAKHANGEWRTLHSRESVFKRDEHGKPIQSIGVAQDITVQRQLEVEKMDLKTEQERVRVLQKFLTDASHDLMTPLTAIKTSLYLMQRQSDDERMLGRIESTEAQVDHLINAVKDMLYTVRLERESDVTLQQIDVNTVIQFVGNRFQDRLDERGVEYSFVPGEDLPCVSLNVVQIDRAVGDLVKNAIQFSEPGDVITLSTDVEDDHVLVTVQDTGAGISDEDLPNIFERFYRGGYARGTHNGGSGLGLPIAKQIAQMHGGDIAVETTPGEGSTFILSLPVAAEMTPVPAYQ